MNVSALGPAQIVLAIAFVIAAAYTVLAYPHKYGALSGRSRLYRTVGIFLLDLLLALVLLVTFIDFRADVTPKIGLLRMLTYLLACVFLVLALLCVALLDWLEGYVLVRRARRESIARAVQDETERVEEIRQDRERH